MIQYLLHTSLLIGLLYGFYRLFLSGETFFGFHRIALLGGIGLAFLLPLVSIPSQYSLKERVTQVIPPAHHEAIIKKQSIERAAAPNQVDVAISKTSSIVLPVEKKSQEELTTTTIDEATAIPMASIPSASSTETSEGIGSQGTWSALLSQLTMSQWLIVIYGMGSSALLLFLGYQLLMLARFRRRGQVTQQGRYTIVEHDDCDQSFSFGRIIYVHKSADKQLDRDHIIRHEMIHARQLHSIDIIIGEVLTIVLWFNPFAWMYKKAMRDNLEFLTDRQMLDEGADTKAYQLSLVRITVPHTLSQLRQPTAAVSLANNYNHSTLKQRIIMMNKKYSSYARVWRHFLAVPVLALTMAICNNVVAEQTPVSPQPTPSPQVTEAPAKAATSVTTEKVKTKSKTKSKSKQQIDTESERYSSSLVDVDINDHIEQAVRIELENHTVNLGDGFISNIINSTVQAVVPATLSAIDLDMDISAITNQAMSDMSAEFSVDGKITGRWEIDSEDNCLHFWMRGKNHFSNWTECDYSISDFKSTGEVYQMTREAGTLTLTGTMDGKEGEGKFEFAPDENFNAYLKSQGISAMKEMELMHLFNTNINKAYIAMVKGHGFDVDKSSLVALAVHSVDDDEFTSHVNALKKRGFKTYDLDDIMAMTIHNVDEEYMDEIDGLGFKSKRLSDYVSMRIHDVDKDLVSSLAAAGYDDLSADEVVSMAIHDVSADFIQQIADVGYKKLSVDKIVQLAIHDVDPAFVKEVKSFGFTNIDLDDIIAFAIHGVDSEYIKELKDAGITDLDANDITSFAIHDVDADLIATLVANGFSDLSNDEIMQAAIHDVDTRLIKDLKTAGLSDMKFDELLQFAIHDVDSDYILGIKQLGLTGLDPQDYIQGSIHDVDIDFIEEIMALGFENMSMDDLVQLRIHNIDAKDIKRLQEEEGEKKDLDDYRRRLLRRNY